MSRFAAVIRQKWRWTAVVALTVAVLGGGALTLFHHSPPASQPGIPSSLRSRLTIPLFYPRPLPSGVSLNESSFHIPESNVLVFVLKNRSGNLSISEQARPAPTTFNINNFYQNSVNNTTQFLTTAGQGTVGQLGDGRQFGSLICAQTWIIVTAPAGVSESLVQAVLSAMQPVS